jgi:RNA polymerase sigma-70 factor (ECF subfamily)
VPSSGRSAPDGPGKPAVRAGEGAELLAALAAGDEAAFARVVRGHYDLVYRVAWRMLGGPGEAEDVAQEVFLRLWRGAERLREIGSLRAWLARVATNLAIDRMRRRRPEGAGEMPEVEDPQPGPERNAERSAASRLVDAAIAALPERQRAAIVLTYSEELANSEVAAALGISIEAVESLLARARRNLKNELASNRHEIVAAME